MSFTVAERTHECAIRAALGARSTNLVSAIARRAILQLSAGALIGILLSAAMLSQSHFESTILRTSNWPLNAGLITLFVVVVGMLVCVKPTLRAVRIGPADALKG